MVPTWRDRAVTKRVVSHPAVTETRRGSPWTCLGGKDVVPNMSQHSFSSPITFDSRLCSRPPPSDKSTQTHWTSRSGILDVSPTMRTRRAATTAGPVPRVRHPQPHGPAAVPRPRPSAARGRSADSVSEEWDEIFTFEVRYDCRSRYADSRSGLNSIG